MHEDYMIFTGSSHPEYYPGSWDQQIYVVDGIPYVVENVDEAYEDDWSDWTSYAFIINIANNKMTTYDWVVLNGLDEVRKIVTNPNTHWDDVDPNDKSIVWYKKAYENNRRDK